MKRLATFMIALLVVACPDVWAQHAKAAPPGIPVNQEAALIYMRASIVASGQRCRQISAARLWAMDTGGSYMEVLCDSTGKETGFWYALDANQKGQITKVQAVTQPRFSR